MPDVRRGQPGSRARQNSRPGRAQNAGKGGIERMLSVVGIPGDFDVAHISWRLEYDSFLYQQFSHRALRIYQFYGDF